MMPSSLASASEISEETIYGGALRPAYAALPGSESGVAWSAVFAGAAAAAALSLILLILGVGLGLSSVSPWAQSGVSAATFGISTIAWITFTQLAASGMGGYLAGRLRIKWTAVHTDEVYFRDTAHGFLAWGVATLVTAAVLGSTIGSILSTGAQAGASVAGGAASVIAASQKSGDGSMDPTRYFVDSLFRKDAAGAAVVVPGSAMAAGTSDAAPAAISSAEVVRIFMQNPSANLPPEDVRYVGQLVTQRTGLSQQDAEKRVTDSYARMQTKLRNAEASATEAADKARKASSYAALWLFVSLLMGAFFASLAATLGGRQRDLI